jgi:hypothetical protein
MLYSWRDFNIASLAPSHGTVTIAREKALARYHVNPARYHDRNLVHDNP